MNTTILDGLKLKEFREKRGFTQSYLAEKIGLSEDSSVRRIERTGVTSEKVFHQICDVLNARSEDLELQMPLFPALREGDVLLDAIFDSANQHHHIDLMGHFLTRPNRKKNKMKINLDVLLTIKSLRYRSDEAPLLSLLEDLAWMKINGWINYKIKNFLNERDLEITLTHLNPVFKSDTHHMYLMTEILCDPKLKGRSINLNLKHISKNKYLLYKDDEDPVFSLLEDLMVMEKANWLIYSRNILDTIPKMKINILSPPIRLI